MCSALLKLMTDQRLFLLTLLLVLAGGLQLGTKTDAPHHGPYHGSFIGGGVGLKKPLDAESSLLRGDHAWTMYGWIRSDDPPPARTLLGGFGDLAGEAGTQRYFAVQAGRVSFWTGDAELRTETPLDPGGWQFLAATFEAGELILYDGDGVRLTSAKLKLKPAAPLMHLAPVPALWPDAAHFAGRIADFTLLPRALTPAEVRRLGTQTRNFDLIGGSLSNCPPRPPGANWKSP